MATWRWAIGDLANGPTRELATAFGRRITWRADAAADAQFSLDGDGDEVGTIVPLGTDLYCWRDGTLRFHGRIAGWQGGLNSAGHSVQFSAVDYRAMLNRRVVGTAGVTYTAIDQAAIAWGLITTSQALSGGAWGITNGVGSTSGVLRTVTLDPGKPIGEAIAELGRLDDGFEWEISPTLQLNRWYPRRGVDNGIKLDYGGFVTEVTYGFDPGDFANAVLVTGDQTTTPVAATTVGIAIDPRGRWEVARGYSTIKEQATLNDRAPWLLSQTSAARPDYRVKLKPAHYDERLGVMVDPWGGPAVLGVGDTVYTSFKKGWLVEDGTNPHRAVEIQVIIDGHGGEEVQLGLLAVPA